MNKKITRALRVLDRQLGISYEMVKRPQYGTGAEFLKMGAEFGDGVIVDPDVTYKRHRHYIIQISHYRRLKKAYTKDKKQGVQKYILWLHQHNERMVPLFEELKLNQKIDRIDKRILKIAKGKASSFWSSLIRFLFSFMATFGGGFGEDEEEGDEYLSPQVTAELISDEEE